MKHTLFITGGAGYVGAMLADQFSKRDDVEQIICLDKEVFPEMLKNNPKIFWVDGNTSDGKWQEIVRAKNPDVVIHTAWQIREMYGDRATEWKWNIDGSDAIFDFAFSTPSVKKLIHFSTVSSYGAFPDNKMDYFYKESDAFRKSEYLYSEEKRICEEHLEERYKNAKMNGWNGQVFIVRPAAITGPRGRYERIRFGLQSALSGQLQGGGVFRIVRMMTSFVPVTPKWLRQYIHEDDVTDIVALFSFNDLQGEYEVFNISPAGDCVLGKDMAQAVGKKMLPIYPWMTRLAFFWFWHLTRGKVPTAPGSWKGYSYPIAVDGSKLTKQYDYQYKYQSKDAFVKNEGRYKVNL